MQKTDISVADTDSTKDSGSGEGFKIEYLNLYFKQSYRCINKCILVISKLNENSYSKGSKNTFILTSRFVIPFPFQFFTFIFFFRNSSNL